MSVPVTINIDAVPDDDLFAQLTWEGAPSGIDLDIHLLADSGPGIAGKASLFCIDDCFFYNPAPTWFTPSTGDEIPHLLRDDQGTSGDIESVDLVTAPPNSSYRIAAHYWSGVGSATPTITVLHKSTVLGTYTLGMPQLLSNAYDTWFAVSVAFDASGTPTVSALANIVYNAGACPSGQTCDAGTMKCQTCDQASGFCQDNTTSCSMPIPNPPGSTVPPDFTQGGVGMCP